MENIQNLSVRTQLQHLVENHGRVKITAMLLGLVLRPKTPRIRRSDLSDHLRRDIGLERAPPSRTYRDFL